MKSLNITDFQLTNLNFYQTAFIHKSYCKLKDYEEYDYPGGNCIPLQDTSYETMEFLGDAILGSVVSSYLYERFYKLHHQKYIVLSKHIEDNCNGRGNSNILEDVLEAFIGAIYLDTDYSTAEKFIIHVIEGYVDFTEKLLIDNNYKDQISRYFQRNFNDGSRPIYKHTKKDDIFYCELYHKDKLLIQGEGVSKKKSEQDVSKKALIYFNVIT